MTEERNDNIYHRELNTILKLSTLINSSLKIESVLDNAMRCAEEFINAEASTIYEIDEDKNELFIRLARGEKRDPVKSIRQRIGDGIAGKVVQTGRPMVLNDVSHEKMFSDKFDRMTGFKTRSMVCVPLIIRDKIIGAIQVLNKKTCEHFNEPDLEILTSLSHHIAVAMDNARLYERLEEKFQMTEHELKSTQERLLLTERIAAMGHLVNGIAHEIRNPITVIGGFTRRLRGYSGGNPDFLKYTDMILQETERLERLVKQVRKLAEVQEANLKPGSIVPVIDEIIGSFKPAADEKNIEMVIDMENDLPPVNIDNAQMITALSNIIENAFESMNHGGRLSLKVKPNENMLIITVEDTGSGIVEEELGSVYDPFVTSKTTGVGLGLTMTLQIVINHGGDIKIQSREREGTDVTIKIPISNKNQSNIRENPLSKSVSV